MSESNQTHTRISAPLKRDLRLCDDLFFEEQECKRPRSEGGLSIDTSLLEAGASKDMKNSAGDTAATLVQQALAGAHIGIFCDRSGMNPIVGNRYTLQGEDLCESEFQKLTSQEQRKWKCIPPLTPSASFSVIAVLLAA